MADEPQEVIFKLTVAQKDAAAQVDQLAGATEKVAKATDQATASYQRMGGAAKQAAKEFDPVAAARRVLQQRDQAAAVQREIDRQRPGPGMLSQLANSAVGRAAAGYGALRALDAGGGFARDLASRPWETGGATADRLAGGLLRKIPGVSRAMDLIEAKSGLPGQRIADAEFLRTAAARIGVETASYGLRSDAGQEILNLQRERDSARLAADAARSVREGLTPGVLASFRPRPRFGEATEATGELRYGAYAAGFGVTQAERGLAAERARQAGLQGEAAFQGQRAAGALGQLDRSLNVADRAALAAKYGYETAFGGSGAIDRNAVRDLAAQSSNTTAQAAALQYLDAVTRQQTALNALKSQSVNLAKAEATYANATYQMSQADLALQRDKLAIVNQQVERGRSGATYAANAQPGQLQADLAAVGRDRTAAHAR